jgi:Fur family ferric uptake transcriptional regulator
MQKIRLTTHRRIILEEIQKYHSHPTVDDIYNAVRKRIPDVSLGTVYRNLELLVQNGLIGKIESSSSKARYDYLTHKHYHIRCISCGKLQDTPIENSKEIENIAKKHTEYEILGHEIEFLGKCPKCQRGKK